VRPEGIYIPDYASNIVRMKNSEVHLSEALKSLGRPQTRLNNLIIENLFSINTPMFPAGTQAQRELLHIIIKIMASAGFIQHRVPMIEFRDQPHRTLDELTALVLASRLRFPSSDDFGGTFATLQQLEAVLLTILKEFMFVKEEAHLLVKRFRLGLGHIGWKLHNGQPISQFERSIFAAYRDTSEGSLGYSVHDPSYPIAANQVSDDLVSETMALYASVSPATTFWSNVMMMSDKNLEHLTMFLGVVPSKFNYYGGSIVPFGPFHEPRLELIDSISWSPQQQLRGVYNSVEYLTRVAPEGGSLQIRTPTLIRNSWLLGDRFNALLLDHPDITWHVHEVSDIAKAHWSYNSKWRGRSLSSDLDNIDLADVMIDIGLVRESTGANAMAATEAIEFGPADYEYLKSQGVTPWENTEGTSLGLTETFWLPPRDGGNKIEKRQVDLSSYYLRRGVVAARSVFGELAVPERSMFMSVDANVVRHVAARESLTTDETLRFERAIGFAHEVSRWERVTGSKVDFDPAIIISAMTGLKP